MATVTEIPELVKAMNHLFGERWGRRLGRAIVVLILIALTGAATTAVMAGIGGITSWVAGLSPTTSVILRSIVLLLILAIAMIGVGVAIGAFIGTILQITLAIPMRQNIDSLLEQSELLLLNANQSGVKDADKLLADVRLLKNRWDSSRTTRVANWIFRKRMGKRQK